MNHNFATILAAFGIGPKPIVSHAEQERRRAREQSNLGHRPTPSRFAKKRGMGYTRASHEESKSHRKMAAKSRHINWGK